MAADKENTASGGTSAVKTSSTRPDRAAPRTTRTPRRISEPLNETSAGNER